MFVRYGTKGENVENMRQKIDDTTNELISFKCDSNGPRKVIDVVLNGIAD